MVIEPQWQSPPSVVIVGQMFDASRTLQRVAAMKTMGCPLSCIPITPEGHNYETRPSLVTRIRYRLRVPGDPAGANQAILAAITGNTEILWLDAADMIRADTLRAVKQKNPALSIVWYSEDDMMNPRLRTRWLEAAMPHIDLWVTTKSFNTDANEIPALGVRHMLFVNNSYAPEIHRPYAISPDDKIRYAAPVSFIGTYEEPRAKSVLHLAQSGYEVRVWGNGWDSMKSLHDKLKIEGRPAYNDEFAKVIAASDINLCFLRHANRDLQTCRSIEIPGCAGFMAHERNPEIEGIFREGQEAVFFSNDNELSDICATWLGKNDQRRRVAEAARQRVEELSMDHRANLTRVYNELIRLGKVQGQ